MRTEELKWPRRRGRERAVEVVIEGITPHHGESVGECPCAACDALYYWNHVEKETQQ